MLHQFFEAKQFLNQLNLKKNQIYIQEVRLHLHTPLPEKNVEFLHRKNDVTATKSPLCRTNVTLKK